MTDPSGLALEAFDAIDDFEKKVRTHKLEDVKRRVHNEHPLVILVESALEAISGRHLSVPIVGFSRDSEERLVSERRVLEDSRQREGLQLVLFSFESICPIVRRTFYTSADVVDSSEFFEHAMPAWLESIEKWAGEDVMKVATADLESSRALLQRLLAIQDALLATTLTIVSLLIGLGFPEDRAAVVLLALPAVVVLAYVDATTRVHFRRVSQRVARLEMLFHQYVVVLRELKTARSGALRNLRRTIDAYQFGIERPADKPVCLQTAGGGIAKLDKAPEPASGAVTLVPCPAEPTTPPAGASPPR